ncbi:xylulokinase [Mycolicibacterium moriokaense]|nr:xylulokinase [Mycolicibacterium moriokaense]
MLGVDSSTQSCKVEVRELASGRLLARGAAPHPPAYPPSSEQHPQAWVAAFVDAARGAVARCEESVQVRAIAVAAQCHGLVLVDDNGHALRPAKLWNDTTGAANLARLTETIGAQIWLRRIGSTPTSAFTIAKLAWVAEHEPAVLDRAASILLPHDYLTFWLTGARVTDRSDASGTGYFDPVTGEWIPEYLNLAGGERDWAALLPQVLGPCQSAGTVRAAALADLGLDGQEIVVAAGGGDQHAAYLGLGLTDGDQYIGIGTSGVIATSSRTPVYDPSRMVDGVCDLTGGYLPLVSTLNAARVGDVAARLLGVGLTELADLALAAGDAVGPVLVPFLDGERKPDRPHARGALADVTSHTTREELARAFVEGPLLSLMSGRDHLRDCGVALDGAAVAVGGGARSAATLQLLADLLDDEVLVLDAEEATARGACVQAAAVAIGADVAGLTDFAKSWQPEVLRRVSAQPHGRDLATLRGRWAELAACPVFDSAGRE